MAKLWLKLCAALMLTLLCVGCGHTKTSRVALISFGDVAGKTIPDDLDGPMVQGSDAGYCYYLSEAAREALKGSGCDTLVDVEVTTKTGLMVPSNKIIVRGKAVDSATLK